MPTTSLILVTGDLVLDYHLYAGERQRFRDETARGLHLVVEAGGAALTHRLLSAVVETAIARRKPAAKEGRTGAGHPGDQEMAQVRFAYELPDPITADHAYPDRLRSYALWAPQVNPETAQRSWRVKTALGYGSFSLPVPAAPKTEPGAAAAPDAAPFPKLASDLPGKPDVLVLDDAGSQFRDPIHRDAWLLPKRGAKAPRWIVLKTAGALGQGALWNSLQENRLQDRLVIVVSADTLRQMEVGLSHGLSWEQHAGQLIRELASNPALAAARQCRHLIVNFGDEGAVWVEGANTRKPKATLLFDPAHLEGEWSGRYAGEVFGSHVALAAAVAYTLAVAKDQAPNLMLAVKKGLSGMRRLRAAGHGATERKAGARVEPVPGNGYPVALVAEAIITPADAFGVVALPWPGVTAGKPCADWSILAANQGVADRDVSLLGYARQVAIRGMSALGVAPYLNIGRLLTAGVEEMESLRLLRQRMVHYRQSEAVNPKPLSFGVFGPPGAGKSFGVKELANGIFGTGKGDYEGWMEFNLSQFKDDTDLIGALHQVRDCRLRGLVPVVFWDEFDSGNFKWLQYLLAPMQDGKFQEGQITHPIGKSIFIFAGATSSSFECFGPREDDLEEYRKFKLAKGPDFKSRLDASLNVLGPNRPKPDGAKDCPVSADRFCPVRRAILIRALLGCKPAERLDIDSGLLTALLEVKEYRHGARSLDKMLEPLREARKRGFKVLRSQLAADHQLRLFVEPAAFHALMQRDDAFKQERLVAAVAPAIHEAWRKIARREKWRVTYDQPYARLPSNIQRSNVAAARRMPENLALVGLTLVPGRATVQQQNQVKTHLALHLELLAEMEHEGWMTNLLAEGWRYDPVRKDSERKHNCLRPFCELSEADREKDRDSIRHYPDFAAEAGWKIVFQREVTPRGQTHAAPRRQKQTGGR